MSERTQYADMMLRRVTWQTGSGFKPVVQHDFAFDFQTALIEYACLKGRSAVFADCGLGKTAIQLAWCDNVVRKTNKSVLLLTPLAVAQQTLDEAAKFGVEASISRDGKHKGGIVISNYERLHHFDPSDFVGLDCDESSALKNFDGKRRQAVTDFAKGMHFRLLCTATPSPNDYHELGTSSEALGYLGYRDMITTFFTQLTERDGLGWGRTKYRLRGHAERPFWRWVVSWARAIRKPSDLGFNDNRYELPPLIEHEHVIENSTPREGLLFAIPARGQREELEERRVTIAERCEKMAELSSGTTPVINWCHLNTEADILERLIPDAKQISGSMKDEQKEELLQAFSRGEIRVLITKPKIGCWGLNWQHCNRINTFPSHSFEQYYQAIRRCWRFGQTKPVNVNIVATAGEAGVMSNLRQKAEKASEMFENLVACMNREIALDAKHDFTEEENLPLWL